MTSFPERPWTYLRGRRGSLILSPPFPRRTDETRVDVQPLLTPVGVRHVATLLASPSTTTRPSKNPSVPRSAPDTPGTPSRTVPHPTFPRALDNRRGRRSETRVRPLSPFTTPSRPPGQYPNYVLLSMPPTVKSHFVRYTDSSSIVSIISIKLEPSTS